MATNLTEAEAVLEASKNAKIFQVGHNRRFAPVYVKLKELIADDKVHSAHIKMNRGELQNPEWTGDTDVTGGFLYETTENEISIKRRDDDARRFGN
jgi:predicted dehydrogenase